MGLAAIIEAAIILERNRAYGRKHYAKNRDKILARSARRRAANPEESREYNRRWKARHPGKKAATERVSRATPKGRAQRYVQQAVRRGRLRKPTACEGCAASLPASQIHGHHESYERDQWLVVQWLCAKCHGLAHRKKEEDLT